MLIDAAYFRTFNSIDSNVESKDIDKKIVRAERKLRFVIGPAFYDQIVTQFEAQVDTSGLSAENLGLYDPYIKEFLAAEAFVILVTKSTFSITRTGLRTFLDENSEKGSDKLIAETIRDAKNESESFKGSLVSYILQEQRRVTGKFPLYSGCGDRMGTGFHITSVTRREDAHKKIDDQINNYAD